jgi:hypothetical protein
MARDDERRKSRFADDEPEEDLVSPLRKRAAPVAPGAKPGDGQSQLFSPNQTIDSQSIDVKMGEVKALLDQTHQLYQHYFNGIEKRPPIEKARLLESRIGELQRLPIGNPTSKFKVSNFITQYRTFKDLWERKLRDREKN